MRPFHWIAIVLVLFSCGCDFKSREAAKRKQMQQNLKALGQALEQYRLRTESEVGDMSSPPAETADGTQADDERGSEAAQRTDFDVQAHSGGSAGASPSRDAGSRKRVSSGAEPRAEGEEPDSASDRKVFSLSAEVAELKLCPAGLIDCIRLADGRSVHFPSQSADAIRSVATVGALLKVTGWHEAGSQTLHATSIHNPKSGESLEVDFDAPAALDDFPRK